MPPSLPPSLDLEMNYNHFGDVYIRNDINPADYLSAIAPGWLDRKFDCARGVRMESDLEEVSYKGKTRFGATGTRKSHLFALQRPDGLWDTLFHTARKEKWIDGSFGVETEENRSEVVIYRCAAGLSRETVLEHFARQKEQIAERANTRAVKAAEALRQQMGEQQEKVRHQAWENSFFKK